MTIINNSWDNYISFNRDYLINLKKFLREKKDNNKVIYPHSSNWFRCFRLTPFEKIKVVIIGQDPYHGTGQANGLCFSVNKEITSPPSLKNIFKELYNDCNIKRDNTDLTDWALQGVLLLNSVLTVEKNRPASHANKGWENFTDYIIEILNQKKENLVFILWGKYAQQKAISINSQKHLILKSAHPSPYSVANFFGCKHFSKTNEYLEKNGLSTINW